MYDHDGGKPLSQGRPATAGTGGTGSWVHKPCAPKRIRRKRILSVAKALAQTMALINESQIGGMSPNNVPANGHKEPAIPRTAGRCPVRGRQSGSSADRPDGLYRPSPDPAVDFLPLVQPGPGCRSPRPRPPVYRLPGVPAGQ